MERIIGIRGSEKIEAIERFLQDAIYNRADLYLSGNEEYKRIDECSDELLKVLEKYGYIG